MTLNEGQGDPGMAKVTRRLPQDQQKKPINYGAITRPALFSTFSGINPIRSYSFLGQIVFPQQPKHRP